MDLLEDACFDWEEMKSVVKQKPVQAYQDNIVLKLTVDKEALNYSDGPEQCPNHRGCREAHVLEGSSQNCPVEVELLEGDMQTVLEVLKELEIPAPVAVMQVANGLIGLHSAGRETEG